MIDLKKIQDKCFGCGACQNICPCGALKMVQNKQGFLEPTIVLEDCIDCHLCDDVCPIDKISQMAYEPKVFAAVHKQESVLMHSSSGGTFTALSDIIIDNGGIVVGAIYDSQRKEVCHSVALSKEERDRMRGSKYVQSNTEFVYRSVREALNKDQWVLFVGTSCQINGLYNYLRSNTYTKLITCDILCHGVASPWLFKKSVEFLESKYHIQVDDVDFRNKIEGWNQPHPIVVSKNKKFNFDFYMKIYYKNVALRECCYCCQYAKINRVSDITIGDFWGIEKANLDISYKNGCSLILVNTLKGKILLKQASPSLALEKSNLKDCMQFNLIKPTQRPENREKFWDDVHAQKFSTIIEKYGEYGLYGKLRVILRKFRNKIWEIVDRNE